MNPYAAKAIIEHEFDTDHLNVWLTFRHTMDEDVKPPLALWLLEADDMAIDITDSAWQDAWTLLLTSDTVAAYPARVTLEYNGPNSNLQTTWGKDWEPWGPILSTDIGKGLCFVDRGDPATRDFTTANFTADDLWHDLDLSAIVPALAKAVLIYTSTRDNIAGQRIIFRKNGNTNSQAIAVNREKVANLYNEEDQIVACDANRIIEYRASNVVWTTLYLTVKGWWF